METRRFSGAHRGKLPAGAVKNTPKKGGTARALKIEDATAKKGGVAVAEIATGRPARPDIRRGNVRGKRQEGRAVSPRHRTARTTRCGTHHHEPYRPEGIETRITGSNADQTSTGRGQPAEPRTITAVSAGDTWAQLAMAAGPMRARRDGTGGASGAAPAQRQQPEGCSRGRESSRRDAGDPSRRGPGAGPRNPAPPRPGRSKELMHSLHQQPGRRWRGRHVAGHRSGTGQRARTRE